ncbi:MAG: hypothetical protein NTV80_06880 [Verrucomicrobia bacterium]|nr:hypothetical protein [Verrucomicrobiota bacterium]
MIRKGTRQNTLGDDQRCPPRHDYDDYDDYDYDYAERIRARLFLIQTAYQRHHSKGLRPKNTSNEIAST